MSTDKAGYLPNLDGLRFVAALFVLVAHFESVRVPIGEPGFAVRNMGRMGFLIFFTMSGFLLTYLLIKEKDIKGKIDVRRFYLRRILRIWPLYYFVLILEFIILPRYTDHPDYTRTLALYLMMLPNIAMNFFPEIFNAIWTWSIGVHEQFYLFWPKVVGSRHRERDIVLVTIGVFLFSLCEQFFTPDHILHKLALAFPFHHIGIGALYALMAISERPAIVKVREFFFRPWSQIGVLFLVVVLMAHAVFYGIMNFAIYSVVFGSVILNLARNPENVLKLDHPVTNHLGRRAFAIYMIHIFSLRYVLDFCRTYKLSWFWVYLLGILVSIALAEVVYALLERPFLELKKKFAVIEKGN